MTSQSSGRTARYVRAAAKADTTDTNILRNALVDTFSLSTLDDPFTLPPFEDDTITAPLDEDDLTFKPDTAQMDSLHRAIYRHNQLVDVSTR